MEKSRDGMVLYLETNTIVALSAPDRAKKEDSK